MKKSKGTGGRGSTVAFNTPMKLLMQRRAAAAAKVKVAIPERMTYRVLLDGVDVTPRTLRPPTVKASEEPPPLPAHDPTGSATALAGTQAVFQTQLHHQTIQAESTFLSQYGTAGTIGDSMTLDTRGGALERYASDGDIINPDPKDSSHLPPIVVDETLPPKINLTLVETPMIYLYEKASVVEEKGSHEGNIIEVSNEYYDYLTKGKGRNRKMLNAEAQTNDNILKSRSTNPMARSRQHSFAFASGWDMIDTMKAQQAALEYVEVEVEDDMDPVEYERQLREAITGQPAATVAHEEDVEVQFKKLGDSVNFQNAVMIMERILDTTAYKEPQTRVRGLIKPDPFLREIDYNYRLDLLWSFTNTHVYDRPVTMVAWNKFNEDMLAVGYGKFQFTERKHGMVCIWNIKNPSQPERQYSFSSSVTGVCFSDLHPNLLAICFYDGIVKIIDVIDIKIKIIAQTTRSTSFSYEPLWGLYWILNKDYSSGVEERVVTVGQDGRVCAYRQGKSSDLLSILLIRVSRMEGRVKGIKQLRHCECSDIPISVYPAILCSTIVPYDSTLYLIGTDEGTVHKCSKYYLNQHLEIFLAHSGPVYQIAYSPFCNRVFLTCGADWTIRIWADGIFEPLITLDVPLLAVQCAVWSPSLGTVVAGVCGCDVYIWNIGNKTYVPASVISSPTKARITSMAFTSTGRNLLIGDVEGSLHLYSLEDMPFPPFYQADVLTYAIKKALLVRPDLLKLLRKSGKLYFNPKLEEEADEV